MTKRRLLIRGVLLLILLSGGAIVNVAVAWGCAVLIDLSFKNSSWAIGEPLNAEVYQQPCRARVLFDIRSYSLPTKGELAEWGSLPRWTSWPSELPIDLEIAASRAWNVVQDASGFPLLSMVFTCQRREPSYNLEFRFAIPYETTPWDPTRALPLLPIWPGFAINTIFYAAVLWMMYFAPFALRRRLRIRRGLCRACAYPIGSSPVCTECGANLPLPSGGAGEDRGEGA